jgi:predicted small lipoprotein YifL
MINRFGDKTMRSVRRLINTALMVGVLALLSSCGQKAPLQFGPLELSGKKIDNSAPSSGIAEPKDWPSGCSLLEKSEVKSLLPNSKVSLNSKDVKVLTGRGADYLIPDGQCQVESNQPGGRSNYSDLVWVDVQAWGAPSAVRDRARITDSPSNKDLANSLGPQQCVELGGAHDGLTPTLRCFQGPLAFDVRGAVGAKTEIAGAASDSEEVMLWYENVVKPVARAAGAHVQV